MSWNKICRLLCCGTPAPEPVTPKTPNNSQRRIVVSIAQTYQPTHHHTNTVIDIHEAIRSEPITVRI